MGVYNSSIVARIKKMWGKWLIVGGVILAIITFLVSAIMGLLPFVNLSHIRWSDDTRGDTYTFTQGFWNLKFYSGSINGVNDAIDVGDVHASAISLSATGITICTLMGISTLSILIGFMETGGKLFTSSSGNKFFCWFTIYVIVIMILVTVAMLLGNPSEDRLDPKTETTDNIWRSSYFAGSYKTVMEDDPSNPGTEIEVTTVIGGLSWPMKSLWIRPTNNYYVLLGITILATVCLIASGLIVCKHAFLKQSEISSSQIKRKRMASPTPSLNPTL